MKLVDILARELKVWPDGAATVDQSTIDLEVYAYDASKKLSSTMIFLSVIADDPDEEVTRAQWQAAVDALNKPPILVRHLIDNGWLKSPSLHLQQIGRAERKLPEWSGDGLPPVGTVCEWHPSVHGWVTVTILGRDGDCTWYRVKGDEASQTCRHMTFFRPVRTPEQIAAEERAAQIEQMILVDEKGSLSRTHFCGMLYDSGYRKLEIANEKP